MKKQFNILQLFLLLIPFLGFSNDGFNYTKQKTISKAYVVNSDAGLNIDNSYGNIFVATWNEDKIEIEVLIKVSGNDEKWVNQKLDGINVDFTALKSLVTAKTVFDNISSKNNGKNNNFEINYTVKIPKNGSVKLNNKYGNIGTSDLFAATDINCSYGKINLGKLNGNSNTIQISYCSNSTMEFIKSGAVTSKYSGLKMDEVNKLDLLSDYSEIEIEQGNDLKYTSRYGSVKIKKVNTLDGNGNYLTIYVGSLFNQLKMSARYSNISVDAIQSKAGNVSIEAAYTGVNVGFNPNYAFDFDVSLRYGDFKSDNEMTVNSREETNTSKKIGGFYKKKGENKVTISASYGNVKLNKKENQ
ncbi:DUF4097 family beta strand repeat-containing protein [Flavobacterium gilvum]|uniref:DUF4097 domain-containing protein n=1 Tax=Flavobacterium gilvum TaxID=1492737 RepID=A0AAC9I7G4_9FLAO|nr:DUF4097 family beta strand repeat-containing protein [Flavobacterium gilvum]AOW10193.1 hypothetical protein EM308_12125 [Flavobacterium gilvum]KFC58619.1 hypothetical protein FEM08_25630 [Flavobacterium gilvum]